MVKLRIVFFIAFCLLVSCVFGPIGTSKRALKQLDKSESEKARELTTKALAKDSLSPAALYTKSRVLLTTTGDQLDSAYFFVRKAIAVFDTLEVKEVEKHEKAGFDATRFNILKRDIDSLSFARATAQNTEEAFIYFTNNYPDAKQVVAAKLKRDALAYAAAKKVNSYQSYKAFMERYPKAVQVPEAKRRYEKLYFDKSTADGRVASYIRFLESNPETPYRRDAEQKIFEVVTAEHNVGGYQSFLSRYPSSFLRQKAINYAYHVAKETGHRINAGLMSDSLSYAQPLEKYTLLPFLENGTFGFMSLDGRQVIKPFFKSVWGGHLCQATAEDFLQANGSIVGRNGALIYAGQVDEVKDLGYGLMLVLVKGKYGLIHKSGDIILKPLYKNIRLLEGKILAVEDGQGWRVQTVSGRVLAADNFDDVFVLHPFVIFEKGDYLEVKTTKDLLSAVDNNPIGFSYEFSDYELMENGRLWLKTRKGEGVVDRGFKAVVPFNSHKIKPLSNKGILIDKGASAVIMDSLNYPKLEESAQKVIYNDSWVGIVQDTSNLLFNLDSSLLKKESSGALTLLGQHCIMLVGADSVHLYFQNGSHRSFTARVKVNVLNGTDAPEYIVIQDDQRQSVYTTSGSKIYEGDDKVISPLGAEYLVVNGRKGRGLLSSQDGKAIVPSEYDAIGNYQQGYVSLLKKKQFGLFNHLKEVFIKPNYDKNLEVYNDNYLLAVKDGKSGFLTADGQSATEFVFDEVRFWNDTSALVKQESQWHIYHIATQAQLLSNIESLHPIATPLDEKQIIVRVDGKYGIMSDKSGLVVPVAYNDIINIGTEDTPVYFTEKHIEEAEFYVVIYYDAVGNILRKQAFESDEYDQVFCDQ